MWLWVSFPHSHAWFACLIAWGWSASQRSRILEIGRFWSLVVGETLEVATTRAEKWSNYRTDSFSGSHLRLVLRLPCVKKKKKKTAPPFKKSICLIYTVKPLYSKLVKYLKIFMKLNLPYAIILKFIWWSEHFRVINMKGRKRENILSQRCISLCTWSKLSTVLITLERQRQNTIMRRCRM